MKRWARRRATSALSRMRTPNGRLATPEDVANVALLLASPRASMIQGQTIVVDGGYSILA